MYGPASRRSELGFSLLELLVSVLILAPLLAATFMLFSTGVNQHASEQKNADASQDARAALELMTLEIAQAGAHADRNTTCTSPVSPSATEQSVFLASAAGITAGDYIEIGTGVTKETVKLTAVGSSSITGVFRMNHANGDPVRLFALPYSAGVIPPAGLAASSSATTTQLQFFGDTMGDGTISYVVYSYDSANGQITRASTPITQGAQNAAVPLVGNISPNSVSFTLNTDNMGIVTSVGVAFAVRSTWRTGTQYQETALSGRTVVPSAIAASTLMQEIQTYGGYNRIPATPAQVASWAGL